MNYNRDMMNSMADGFEQYLNALDFITIEGLSQAEKDDAVKTVKKLIKRLRKGEGDKVFNEQKYIEYMENLRK